MVQIFFTLIFVLVAENGIAAEWWSLKKEDSIFLGAIAGSIKLDSVKTSPNSYRSTGEIPYVDPTQSSCQISIRNPMPFRALSGDIKWRVMSLNKDMHHYNFTGQIGGTSVEMFMVCPGPAGPSGANMVPFHDAPSNTRNGKARLGHK